MSLQVQMHARHALNTAKASRYGTALHIACATHVPADFNGHKPGPLPTYCMSTTRLRPPVECTPRCYPGTTWLPSGQYHIHFTGAPKPCTHRNEAEAWACSLLTTIKEAN